MEKVSLTLNRITHHISSVIMLLLTTLTVLDVAGRYLFNRPIFGTYELTEFAMIIIVFLAFGYAEHNDDHISIDLVYTKFPRKMQYFTNILTTLITLAVILLMAWRLYLFSDRMQAGNYVTQVLSLPIHTMVLVATFGTLCYALAVLSTLVKSIRNRGEYE